MRARSSGPVSDHLRRLAYTTAYDRRLRIPAWTAEHLTKEGLKGAGTRAESVFKEDEAIPSMFRAHLLDYFKSGYGAFIISETLRLCVCSFSECTLTEQIGVIWCLPLMPRCLKRL